MNIAIHASRIDLDDDLRAYVERRLRFAVLDRPGLQLRVWLADVNGPRGGRDKLCRVIVSGGGGAPTRIEDLAETLEVAVNRAAGRLAHRLRRQARLRRSVALHDRLAFGRA